jgi:hypothetical protein
MSNNREDSNVNQAQQVDYIFLSKKFALQPSDFDGNEINVLTRKVGVNLISTDDKNNLVLSHDNPSDHLMLQYEISIY